MTKLTIETLKEIIGSYPEDSDEIECVMARQLLAYEQADKTTDLKTLVISEIADFFATFESPSQLLNAQLAAALLSQRLDVCFATIPAQPVIPEQPESKQLRDIVLLTANNLIQSGYSPKENSLHPWESLLFEAEKALAAQPVIPERPELRYGDNVLWFLNELAAFDSSDIDSDDFDVYGEDRNGVEGCANISITELAADAAKLLSAQPVSEPYKLPVGYFSYGTEHGFNWHQTAKQATDDAEAMIDDYRGDACDGWSEETDSVCWGVILQRATKVDERPRTDDDKCDPTIDTVCDYALLPARESE